MLERLLPFAVSALALAWVFSRFDLGQVMGALDWRVAQVLVPALLAYGVATLVLEARSILRLLPAPPSAFGAWTAARIKCASYLLGIVNYALGGAALAVLLRRRAGLALGEAAGVVLLISLTDLCVVLALGALGAAAQAGGPAVRAGVVATAGVGFFGGLVLLRLPRSLGPLERIRSLSVFDALRHTPSPRLAELALIRIAFGACFLAVSAAAFAAFQVEVEPARLVAGVMILAVLGALPIAVAGLGIGQIAAVEVFRGVAPAETLIALSLVLSTGMIALRAAMGVLFAREFTREALAETRAGA
jgi:hypothetical protein